MRAWQIRISSYGRETLFPDEATRRKAVRALVRVTGPRLICFSIPDDHGHMIVLVHDGSVRQLARSIRLSWLPLADAPLEQPWVRPFRSRIHLQEAFEYQLNQNAHHGLLTPSSTWSGCSFADLVGARVLDGLDCKSQLREALPRYRLRGAYRAVGLPPRPLAPASDDEIEQAGLARLADAASFACCAPPDLRGKSRAVVQARLGVVDLGARAGFDRRALGRVLGVGRTTVHRLDHGSADPHIVLAIRLRLTLEDAVSAASRGPQRDP